MKKWRSLLMLAVVSLITAVVLIACSNEGTTTDPKPGPNDNGNGTGNGVEEPGDDPVVEEPDEITLQVGVIWDENMFNERFKIPIEDQFPHITLEHIHVNHFSRESLEEMFGAGVNPDFYFTLSQSDMEYFKLDQDMTDLLEKYAVDTSGINPALFDGLRARDPQGRLLAWPYEDTYYAIMYNKDIFDLFGEDYPHDNMTWDELIDLAGRLTQERDGIQYRGLDIQDEVMLSQLSVNATDPETGEVQLLNNEAFSIYLNTYKRLFNTIPNNYEVVNLFTDHRFIEQQTAMVVTNAQALNWRQESGINYDIAAVPTFPHLPGVGPRGFLHTLTMSPDTEHEAAVIRIFEYLASDEYQEWMARNGIGIVSSNKDVQNEFYADYESTHGLNIPAIFKNNTAVPPERISIWDQYVSFDLQRFYESGMDTNEYLRVITEESETKILEAKEQQN